MELQKQTVAIPLTKGVDTKSDPKQLSPGSLLDLQNATFTTSADLSPRAGNTALSQSIASGGSISSGIGLESFQNSLLLLDGQNAYTYGQTQTKWNQVGSTGIKETVSLSSSTIIANSTTKLTQDFAYHSSGLQLFTWEESTGGSRYSVQDSATGSVIVSNALLGANYTLPKCITFGSTFIILCLKTTDNNIYGFTISTSTPTSISGATQITNDGTNGSSFDAIVGATYLYVAYQATNAKLIALNSSLAIQATMAPALNPGLLSVFVNSGNGQVWIAASLSNGVGYYVYDSSLSTGITSGSIVDTSPIQRVTGFIQSNIATILYETSHSTGSQDAVIRQFTAQVGFSPSAPSDYLRSVGLASKIFLSPSNVAHVVVTHQSTEQSTYFLCRLDGHVAVKLSPLTGGGLASKAILPSVLLISGNKYFFPYLQQVETSAVGGVVTFKLGIFLATFQFNHATTSVQQANNLHISGGVLSSFDGRALVEHGFHFYPETVSGDYAAVGGGLSSGGSYSYVATYEWIDSLGQVHQSAPTSTALSVKIDGHGTKISAGTGNTSNVLSVGGFVNAYYGLVSGMAITDALSAIPANSTITGFNPGSPNQISISNSATSTTTRDITTCTPEFPYVVSNQDVATLSHNYVSNRSVILIYGILSSGSAVVQVGKTSSRMVGATVTENGGFIPGGTTILSVTDTTITLSAAVTGVTTATNIALTMTQGSAVFTPPDFLNVGQTATNDSGVTTYTITGFGTDGGGSYVTFDKFFLLSNTNDTFTITNPYVSFVTVPTLRLSEKDRFSSVNIVLWRTASNGTTYFRVGSTPNIPTQDYVTFLDITADYVLTGNSQLYTTGGEVPNIAAPASDILLSYKSRAILIPSENPYSWWYSKQVIPGSPVEFSDLFVQNIDQKGGGIGAAAVMDEKLILFKQSQISFTAGDGPSPSGANNDFLPAQTITTDNGCSNPQSVILIPNGLMYQASGNKGIYLLDRSLSSSYIGAPVESYNSRTVVTAQLVPNTTQVKFVLDNGVELSFDYFAMQWSVSSNRSFVDSCNSQGNLSYLNSSGLVVQELPGAVTDNGSAIVMSFTTGWISMAQVQGYQRLWRLLILGSYISTHTLTVQAAYDFVDTYTQTDTITVNSDPAPYQFRIHLARQKCQSVKFKITMTPTGTLGQGATLSSVAMEVGVKKGANKTPAAVSYG